MKFTHISLLRKKAMHRLLRIKAEKRHKAGTRFDPCFRPARALKQGEREGASDSFIRRKQEFQSYETKVTALWNFSFCLTEL